MLIFITGSTAWAQVDPIGKDKVAIGGYDLVSYFESGKAVKGEKHLSHAFQGATYYFSSAQNLSTFQQSPEKFLPQFDGYCALAVSYGKKLSVDPETFEVKDGKLYLFFHGKTSRGMVNSLEAWQKDEDRLLKKAEKYWPDVKKKKYKSEDTL